MDEGEGMVGVAFLAEGGLGDAPAVYLHRLLIVAHVAAKEGDSHLGDEIRVPDHHATDGDQLINVCNRELVRVRGGA